MEAVMLTQNINCLFASLGCPIGEDYIISDDSQATLEEIVSRLYNEDKYVRGFRRLIANSQVLKKDLLPLFYNVKNNHKILDLIIEILENLMIPVECLFPIDIMIREDAGRSTICQLNWLLTSCKEAFLNPCATKSVIDYIKLIMKKESGPISVEGCRSITLCLNLLRNLLHIPEVRGGAPGGGASHQNQIIWNLFTQHFDKVLLQLMTLENRAQWSVTLVQLISLLFKDQQSNTIYKLLNTWCDTALSESSEDDESNTSPQDQGSNDSSSSMATSDPTSDSSDSDHQKIKTKSEPENKHPPQPSQITAPNRMTEIIVNGAGRKAQVAMRNKHGNSSKNNSSSNKHRQSEPHHVYSTETHTHVNSKNLRASWNGTSESGIGSSVNGSVMMECGSPEVSEYDREREREIIHSSHNQETISTSSNEDKEPSRFGKKKPVHQKPLHMIQKSRCYNGKPPLNSQARKDLLREKLIKRSQTTTMSIKTFLNHTPSEDDVSHLLKEFTVDFLLKGYGPLVMELKKPEILINKEFLLDTSHITWLIMFFLRFATQLELDFHLISPILSFDVISFLTFEGVNLCEELEVTKLHVGENLTRTLRKLYLVIASLKEVIFTIQSYKKIHYLSQADKDNLKLLQDKISTTNDLKYLFIMLLRHFDPSVQSHQFLQDLVVANHSLLTIMESNPQVTKDDLVEHIKQFASEDIMKQYGTLLACFEDNGEMVNNCIFTMMHHVAGDLDKVGVLFQPSVLKSFVRIIESDFQICDDWSDLVEFVIQKCLKTRQVKNEPPNSTCVDNKPELIHREITPVPSEHETASEWSKEDLDCLCWYFPQSMEMDDPVSHISQLFVESSGQVKSRIEIIENLLNLQLIQEDQYRAMMEKEPESTKLETVRNKSCDLDILEGIEVILDYLHGEKCGFFVKWLQNCLLEACFAKLVLSEKNEALYHSVEPVAYYYTLMNEPMPLVTWTQELWKVMQLEPSIWLLSALNFHLPTRAGNAKIFARIPAEWTTDHLYVAALILGPIHSSGMKFDPSTLEVFNHSDHSPVPKNSVSNENRLQNKSSLFGCFLGTSSSADWLVKVKQLKSFHKLAPLEDKHEHMSLNSGDERDWDLTSMCVSEESQSAEDVLELPV